MKKSFLLYVAAILLVSAMIGSSCRKHIIHSSAPTPNNVRMLGYTKITTIKNTTPIAGTPATINENFRFYYDAGNRVSRIIYTGNDSFEIHKTIDFTYKGDSIFKKTTNALNNAFVRHDTFVVNGDGLIKVSNTPFLIEEFEYHNKLLARHMITAHSYNRIKMKAQTTYTSVNGDFLKNYYDGKLDVTFNDLKTDLTIFWLQDTTGTVTWKHGSMSFNKTNYNFHPIYIHVFDSNKVDSNRVKDSLLYAGMKWYNQSYHFYTEDANRTGDYLQLESFTMYGKNIYQNAHLVESITNGTYNTYVKYTKDAYNKITQTQAVETDSLLNTRTYVYDIQYETY